MSGSKSKWRNLLEEKEKRLNASTGETYTVPDGLFDEDEFRSRFNDFCSKNGVIKGRRRHLQLSQKHGSSRSSIIKLSKIADEYAPELRGSAHDGILESLVWKVLLAALEVSAFLFALTILLMTS